MGATLLPDDSTNVGKKNMARGVKIPKQNSKGNVGKNLFVFSDSGRNFHSFFKKKINFHLLDIEHASPNKNI